MKFYNQQLPLFAARQNKDGDWYDWRHLGNSFHVNARGHIATCAHVLMAADNSEQIVGCEFTGRRLILPLSDLRFHPTCDFAVAQVPRPDFEFLPIHGGVMYVGDEVRAFAPMYEGKNADGSLYFVQRLFHGHLVMVNGPPIPSITISRCELSFPVLSGFSGSALYGNCPRVLQQESWRIMGMVHGNYESTIQTYAHKSYSENGKEYVETMHRILELGLAHSALDIRHFLKDLNVPDVQVTNEGEHSVSV